MSKYLSVKYLLISKKLALKVKPFKKLIFGGHQGGDKYLSVNYLLMSNNTGTQSLLNNTGTQSSAVYKIDFGGGPQEVWHPQIISKHLSGKQTTTVIKKKTGTLG